MSIEQQILQEQIRIEQKRISSTKGIETSPVDIGKQTITGWPEGGENGARASRTLEPGQTAEDYPEIEKWQAVAKSPSDEQMSDANRGVDTTTGSSEGRFQQSFMPEGEKAPFIKEQLQKKFGKETKVRKNANGRVEFVSPETKRWTTFDEYGMSVGDLKDMFGESLPLVGDVIGSIAGYALGKAPGEAIGSGAGTFVGEEARLNIGKRLGYHDLSQEEIAAESGGKALTASAAALAGRGIIAGGHKWAYGKNPFSDEMSEAILASSKDADIAVEEINRVISGNHTVSPTMGERSGMPSVMDVEATIQQGSQNIPNAVILRNQKRESERGLEEYFDTVSPSQRPDSVEVGKSVKETFSNQTEARTARAEGVVEQTKATARGEADRLPAQDIGASVKSSREALEAKKEEIATAETKAWEQYKKTAGYDETADVSNVKIPRSKGLDNLLSKMTKERKNAIFGDEGKNKGVLLDSKLGTEEGYDLVHIQRALNYLKKRTRVSSKGLSSEEPDVGDLKRITGELQKARNEHLLKENPELLRQIENAEALTKYKHETFDKGLIGKVLKKDGNNYVLDDEGAFVKIFASNNRTAAKEYSSVLMDDPRAMQAARNTVLALYSKTVVKDGIPDKARHAIFMGKYGGLVGEFFKSGERKQIERLGGLATVIDKHAQKLRLFEGQLKKSFKGKIDSMSPTEMTKALFKNPTKENSMSGLDAKEVSRLTNYLQMYGKEQLEAYRGTVAYEIKTKISKDGVFDPKALRKLLETTGDISDRQTGKLGRLFSPQYAKDMRTLLKVLDMVEKKGVSLGQAPEPAVFSVIKMIMGPLHRQSRFATKAGVVTVKASDRAILEAIMNPDKLRALVASGNARQTQKQAASLLSSLGALSLMADEQ